MSLQVSVIICTHAPHPGRLRRTLAGLRAQTLPADEWETLLVDNASSPAVELTRLAAEAPGNIRVVREPKLGLTFARCRGFAEARAPLCVLVDDDNVLAADYLAQVIRLFGAHARLGALGGRSLPEFEREPAPWHHEFFSLLALRDPGPAAEICDTLRPAGAVRNQYPRCAPVGAGMALRHKLATEWCRQEGASLPDRQGATLSSGGDNDLVFGVLTRGWQVGYFPELSLTHLIPAARLEGGYLARLNYGIQKSWIEVLTKYDANPWPPIAAWTVPLRQTKAWFVFRPWSSPSARIRWRGACGHFAGRARGPA